MKISRTKVDIAMARSEFSTYKTLASALGCTPQNLSLVLCHGSCKPATAAKIAAALGVPLEDLLEEGGTGR